jgi:hypothetical protein
MESMESIERGMPLLSVYGLGFRVSGLCICRERHTCVERVGRLYLGCLSLCLSTQRMSLSVSLDPEKETLYLSLYRERETLKRERETPELGTDTRDASGNTLATH